MAAKTMLWQIVLALLSVGQSIGESVLLLLLKILLLAIAQTDQEGNPNPTLIANEDSTSPDDHPAPPFVPISEMVAQTLAMTPPNQDDVAPLSVSSENSQENIADSTIVSEAPRSNQASLREPSEPLDKPVHNQPKMLPHSPILDKKLKLHGPSVASKLRVMITREDLERREQHISPTETSPTLVNSSSENGSDTSPSPSSPPPIDLPSSPQDVPTCEVESLLPPLPTIRLAEDLGLPMPLLPDVPSAVPEFHATPLPRTISEIAPKTRSRSPSPTPTHSPSRSLPLEGSKPTSRRAVLEPWVPVYTQTWFDNEEAVERVSQEELASKRSAIELREMMGSIPAKKVGLYRKIVARSPRYPGRPGHISETRARRELVQLERSLGYF